VPEISRPDRRGAAGAGTVWPIIARFAARERAIGDRALAAGPWTAAAYEFIRFGVKQGWACLFGGLLLALIVVTRIWPPPPSIIARYDALTLAAVAIQGALIVLRFETIEEAKVILIFHIVGTVMELFKTAIGSWVYPEHSLLRIGDVPLFSGFMYAAIGSYLARAWRLFDFRFARHPPLWSISALSAAIYANFFTHHYDADIRLFLIAGALILFGPTIVYFKVWRVHRRMPLLVGFTLVATFIWFAENIGTGMGAWIYPSQAHRWTMVPAAKLEAWLLLMIVSYTLTALVNRPASLPSAGGRVTRREDKAAQGARDQSASSAS
jgi:uncharacterized membrane protein YoaT (DUF817 family)